MLNLGIIAASNLAAERFGGPSWATFAVISIAIPVANFIVFHWVFAARRGWPAP
jgi:putative flippase GtrA